MANGCRLLLVCTDGRYEEKRKFSLHSYYGEYAYLKFVPEGVLVYERDVDTTAGLDGDNRWSPVASLGDHSLYLS